MILYTFIISFILGTLYYYLMERTIPRESNCSFIASKFVDFIAFVCGFILIYKSVIYNDQLIGYIGGAIITEHIWQLLAKYTMEKIM